MKTNRRLVLLSILIATFLSAIEATIVSTAMPSIIRDLHGMTYVSMIFSIYLLTTAVTTPIYGKLADLFGRKRIITIAIILFLTGSVLSGFAQTMLQLIVFRAIQGLGAGAMMPITSTILGDIFNTEELTRMQALFSGVWAISGVVGPLIGGFIVEALNWRWVFFINVPFGILSLVLLWISYHETFARKTDKSIDWGGALTFLISITSLLYVLLFGKDKGYFSFANLPYEILFVVFLAAFLWIETKASDPFLPLDLFKNRMILIPNLFGFFAFSFLIATTVYFPIWMQQILGVSPTVSGFALAFVTIGWPIGATLNPILIKKIGPWRVSFSGSLLLVLSGVLITLITIHTSIVLFFVVMFIAGLAFGLTTTVFMIILQNAVESRQRGVAMASNALLNTLGQTIFIAIFGAVYNSVAANYGTAGMPQAIRAVFFCVAAVTVISLLISIALPRITNEQLYAEKGSVT